MKDLIVIAIITVVLGMAIRYIIKEKKKGVKCIGCPSSSKCSSKDDNCTCCNHNNLK